MVFAATFPRTTVWIVVPILAGIVLYLMYRAGIRHKLRRLSFHLRQAGVVAKAMKSRRHPIVAQIVPVRRCNLSCAYCNEYDNFSKPVPREVMLRRVDRLAELGTSVVTISGGEPLLHPDLDQIIRRIRDHGAIATLITNGYLLTPGRIKCLNRAGLDHLQIRRTSYRESRTTGSAVPEAVISTSVKMGSSITAHSSAARPVFPSSSMGRKIWNGNSGP